MQYRISLGVALLALCWTLSPYASAGEPRKWTSADGKYTVEGEMIGFTEDMVVIAKSDKSQPIRVPLSKLSRADQEFAEAFKRKALGVNPPSDGNIQSAGEDHWILNSQIKLKLPPGAKQWKVLSKSSASFITESASTQSMDRLFVQCSPFIESRQVRISHINTAIDECLQELKAMRATIDKEPTRIESVPPKRYEARVAGKLRDGTAVESQLLVRFDLEGAITIRAVGSAEFVKAAIDTADKLSYVNPAQPVKPSRESAPIPSGNVPAEKKRSLTEFIDKTKERIEKGDTKEFIETTIDPTDLKQILQSATLEELVKGFDGEKKSELMAMLKELDWQTAKYDAANEQVTFIQKSGRAMSFVETQKGWRLKN